MISSKFKWVIIIIKNLLSKLGNCESPVLLSSPGDQRGKAGHKEVEPWDHYNDDHGDVDHHDHDDYDDYRDD